MDSEEQQSNLDEQADQALNDVRPDFAKRRAELWGDRVFSMEEVDSMRLNELEGVERESFLYASASSLGRSSGNKGPDYSNEGEPL